MAVQQTKRAVFLPQKTLAFGLIGAGYMGVGTSLEAPAREIFIQNLTDALLQFSFDGVNDHFPLPPNGFWVNDIAANRSDTSGFFLSEGDRLYVKQIDVPTSGSVYFSIMYGKGS